MADSQGNLTEKDLEGIVQKRLGAITAANTRELYVLRNMADLPMAYREKMPVTTDAKALAAAEQIIRQEYRADMFIHAPKFLPPMGPAPAAATGAVTAPIDVSKLSPHEAIMVGLKRSKASRAR